MKLESFGDVLASIRKNSIDPSDYSDCTGAFLIFCNFRYVLMKRCSSVNPDRVVSS
ncbi:hypothetical protein KsCSTR_46010 [Candidatus Kuenenia stuttgartiensis]|uniref:Uncharacterized protein n=1 Tax=Kuenenia stuttgartiensis TaxID=174633 RepID=A0A2C9CGR2_KUEST|nr:hypothetical protein [Candidatus Kuenenia sp.]MBZ0193020.1 hypothetical protein [Candidatus Kuenenia stuttgartiensis]MCZ7622945.1 hypothetical protein [Candidatus Kuenenia sp.]QII13980.1 hypothetical protein KsCSTR_46010 [Candidatus Kuenenia stuttgartiensis]SOH04934.1 hypothetical protein KSMBR1_2447 [Candidatus Kuenenia stuttgartiensis]